MPFPLSHLVMSCNCWFILIYFHLYFLFGDLSVVLLAFVWFIFELEHLWFFTVHSTTPGSGSVIVTVSVMSCLCSCSLLMYFRVTLNTL